MQMQLIIDPDTCVGYGECVAEDPEAVELDDQGCARPLLAVLDADRAQRICAACPVSAITLRPAAAAAA
jgi:ferredoxin